MVSFHLYADPIPKNYLFLYILLFKLEYLNFIFIKMWFGLLIEMFFIYLNLSYRMFHDVLEFINYQKYFGYLFSNLLSIQSECFLFIKCLVILIFGASES